MWGEPSNKAGVECGTYTIWYDCNNWVPHFWSTFDIWLFTCQTQYHMHIKSISNSNTHIEDANCKCSDCCVQWMIPLTLLCQMRRCATHRCQNSVLFYCVCVQYKNVRVHVHVHCTLNNVQRTCTKHRYLHRAGTQSYTCTAQTLLYEYDSTESRYCMNDRTKIQLKDEKSSDWFRCEAQAMSHKRWLWRRPKTLKCVDVDTLCERWT